MNKQKQVKKILIIEDEQPLVKALTDKLQDEGFSVSVAHDGVEGLKMSLEEKPGLVLLDLILPKMDGMTYLDKLRDDEWGREVPVIILTNLSDDKKVVEAQKSGVYDYLIKTDWSLDDVIKMVKEKLGDVYND
jgi:DNA-binding response OmpR family regulator